MSNIVLLTVADERLRGGTDLEKAEVIQWLGFADSEILPASCTWVFPCLGIMQYNKQVGHILVTFCNVEILISL
jgi:elongation factor 1-gamma